MALMVGGLFAQTTIGQAKAAATSAPAAATIPGSVYTALANPQRLLAETPLTSPHNVNVTVAGGGAGAPASATAVVLVVTQTSNTGGNYVQVFPAGGSTTASAVNAYYPNQLVSNLVTVPVGAGGQVTLHTLTDCHVIVDEEGYYSPASGGGTAGTYHPIAPVRIAGSQASGQSIAAGTPTKIQVAGANGIPAGATAATVNLTVSNDSVGGFVQTYPNSQPTPQTSNLNYNGGGQVVATRDVVALASDGTFTVWSNAPISLDVDANGWFGNAAAPAGSYYYAGSGVSRVHDTRISGDTISPTGTLTVAIAGNPASGVPTGATAATLNITIDKQTDPPTRPNPGFLEVYPGTPPAQQTSDLNFPAQSIVANADYATLAGDGSVTILNDSSSPVDVIVDAFGYFTTSASQGAPNAISASANPSSIPADGASTSTITATVLNGPAPGTAVPGDVVTFTVSGTGCTQSQLSSNTATTNASGQASVTFTANTTVGTCTITATDSTNSTGGSTTVTQTQPTNQTYRITPNTPQQLTVSTVASPTQGQVVYTLTGVTSANTPTGQVNIALFPSSGPNAPVDNGGTWTFTSSGGPGFAGVAVGQATSNGQTTTTPGSPNQGACGTSCFAYISNVNGTNTTNAPDQVSGVNAPSGGTVTFTVNSFQVDDTIPVVFSTPTSGQTALQLQANGQPASGYPFAVGGDANWAPSAPPAPSGSYSGWYILSANTSNNTFIACNNLPPGPGNTCYTFTTAAGDQFTYPAQNGGWTSSSGMINLTQAQWMTDASGPLTGQMVPTTAGSCSGNWSISNTGGGILCSDGTGSNNSNQNANPDVVDIQVAGGGSSQFSFADQISVVAHGTHADANVDVPAAPTGLAGTASVSGNAANVALHWTAVPNQNVSQDTNSGTNPAVRAHYDIFRALVTGGTPGTFTYVGSTVITAGSPPPTTFADNGVSGSTTYQYAVVAVSSNENGNDSQAAGPASSTFQVTTPAALPAAPGPQVPTYPVSVSSLVTPASGNTSGELSTGDQFQVQFDTNISVAANASFTLTDDDGTQGTVTCGTNATCSAVGPVLTVVLTAPPVITFIGNGASVGDHNLDYNHSFTDNTNASIVFTSVSGTSGGVFNSAGPWDLAWSGCANDHEEGCTHSSPNPTSTWRILATGSANNESPENPRDGFTDNPLAFAYAGSTSVTVRGSGTYGDTYAVAGATVSIYDTNGNLLGSGTIPGTAGDACYTNACGDTVVALSSPLVVGEVLQIVYVGDTKHNAGSSTVAPQPSETTHIVVTWNISTPTATQIYANSDYPQAGFSIGNTNSLGDSQTIPVTVASGIPNSTVWLTFFSSGGCGAIPSSATVGSTALTSSAQLFQTDGSGNVVISYTTDSSATTCAGSHEDEFWAASTQTAGNTTIRSDGYYDYGTTPPAPTVTSVSPTSGPAAGGNLVDIFGTNFVNGATAVFGSDAPVATTYISATELQATVPAPSCAAPCTVGVSVFDNNNPGAGTNQSNTFGPGTNQGYTYGTPAITSLSSTTGPADGGTGSAASYNGSGTITINVSGGADNVTGVAFGGTPAAFTILNETQISAVPPGGATGSAPVTVSNANGTSASSPYSYVQPSVFTVQNKDANNTAGVYDNGDQIIISYNTPMDPSTMGIAGLTAGGCVTGVALNAIVGAGGSLGSYATPPTNGQATVCGDSVQVANGNFGIQNLTITITTVSTTTPSGNFTPNANVSDMSTNNESTAAVTPSGSF